MNNTRYWALAAALFLLASAPAASIETVYVVRHAQKQEPWTGNDLLRPLSAKGVICAERLAEKLADAGVATVYSTETVRTLSTGVAVSGADIRIKISANDHFEMDEIWARQILRANKYEKAILIVGHSNTVGNLVRTFRPDTEACLEELRIADVKDSQYGDVWRLEVNERQECRGVTRESLGKVGDVDCTTP